MIKILIISLVLMKLHNVKCKENVKIWKPNNDIFDKSNRYDENNDCGIVEFSAINYADIYLNHLTAKQFVLPLYGNVILLDGGQIEVVTSNFNGKTDCLKLKEINYHYYLNPENWESENSNNPAVPDFEKIPCIYDKIKFPKGIYSGIFLEGVSDLYTVSSIEFNDRIFSRDDFEDFKISTIGNSVFNDLNSIQLSINEKTCTDLSGCTCNKELPFLKCPSQISKNKCSNPVYPVGFCTEICGSYIIFQPGIGFNLDRIRDLLKDSTSVATHVSKITKNEIQIIFTEEEYSGDSVAEAKKIYEILQKNLDKFRISNLKDLKISGNNIDGGGVSLLFLIFLSFLFVILIYGIIFIILYGNGIRYSRYSPRSLSSTYRAIFNSKTEDESGLIFENQSISGSVTNLDQSFDNPLYSVGEILPTCLNPNVDIITKIKSKNSIIETSDDDDDQINNDIKENSNQMNEPLSNQNIGFCLEETLMNFKSINLVDNETDGND